MKENPIFLIKTVSAFEKNALAVFNHQAKNNLVYRSYLELLGINSESIKKLSHIPFLPIEFFKKHKVITNDSLSPAVFLSSGTTGMERSRHYVSDISIYETSFRKGFEIFYGDIKDYAVLALLPSYYENRSSSLLYMAKDMIVRSRNKYSSFYNAKDETIAQVLQSLLEKKQKVLLLGVSFALLDMLRPNFKNGISKNLIVMETGGMKGRREELTRDELHALLCKKFQVKHIHSEYGMTELLSQAYSKGNGIFKSPPWMKVLVRDIYDPLSILPLEATGALNIIDLANVNSCCFIATQDLGKTYKNGTFEVMGRIDNSDLRGCNLLIE